MVRSNWGEQLWEAGVGGGTDGKVPLGRAVMGGRGGRGD